MKFLRTSLKVMHKRTLVSNRGNNDQTYLTETMSSDSAVRTRKEYEHSTVEYTIIGDFSSHVSRISSRPAVVFEHSRFQSVQSKVH
jgi:hypothetical protein